MIDEAWSWTCCVEWLQGGDPVPQSDGENDENEVAETVTSENETIRAQPTDSVVACCLNSRCLAATCSAASRIEEQSEIGLNETEMTEVAPLWAQLFWSGSLAEVSTICCGLLPSGDSAGFVHALQLQDLRERDGERRERERRDELTSQCRAEVPFEVSES